MRLRRVALALLAPLVAVAFALAVSSVALVLTDHSPLVAYQQMLSYGIRPASLVSIANRTVPLYLSAVAVAIGFKMGLFNIGVEGQYRLAALLAASAGAAVALPAPLHVLFIIAVAAVVGAGWAGIAAVLKVFRGVHEVISTIMLNVIATGLSAWLLANYLREVNAEGDLVIKTPELPSSARMPDLNGLLASLGVDLPTGSEVEGFLLVAALVGLVYWIVVSRTRFGFDLRAAGSNATAALASGVDPRRMTLAAMLLSGAVAGFLGASQVLGFFHRYSIDFPAGLGFTGIAVALVGRNHPLGMAAGALLFAFMDRSAQILDLEGIPKEIVLLMQGTILLSVVVAYEAVRRIAEAQEARAAANATARPTPAEATA